MSTNINEEKCIEGDDIKYEKPDTHKNFWKSFGLNNEAGKLLYHLYGESNKIKPNILSSKHDGDKNKNDKKKEDAKLNTTYRKPQIHYPSLKKKAVKENPIDTIKHRKPLSKILQETQNYDCIKDIPISIGMNRETEKNKLHNIFVEEKCLMVPPSCAPMILTQEEKKEIIEKAQQRYIYINEENKSREEKHIQALRNYKLELIQELNEKRKLLQDIINEDKNIQGNISINQSDKRVSNKGNSYNIIQIKNDIEQCQKSIKKIEDNLNTYE